MSAIAVEFTRKKLYEEIWKLSVAGVARKYGIPYAKCLAQVKEAQIPVPPSGYWTKINFGKLVEQTPLPGDGDATVILQKDDSQRANPTGWEETCQASPSKANPGPEIPMVFLLWSQPHKRLRRRKLDKGAIRHWRRFKDGGRPFMCMIGKRCTGKFGRVP